MAGKRKMNPNSLKNLELGKFKKGHSGNPRGPRKKSIRSVVDEFKAQGYAIPSAADICDMYRATLALDEEALKARINDKSQPMIVRIVAKNVLGGKGFDIAERMLDRSIGRATQSMDITSGGEKLKAEPLRIEVIDKREQVKKKEE